MTCSSCVSNVERNVKKLDGKRCTKPSKCSTFLYSIYNVFATFFAGIKNVLVNLMSQKAEVKYDPAYIMPSQIANEITDLGYPSTVIESSAAGQATVNVTVCFYSQKPRMMP